MRHLHIFAISYQIQLGEIERKERESAADLDRILQTSIEKRGVYREGFFPLSHERDGAVDHQQGRQSRQAMDHSAWPARL